MRIFITIVLVLWMMIAHAYDFTLTSDSFANNQKIPVLYTCDGRNISPYLKWENAPINTQSYVLLCTTPDSPVGTFYNWIVFNIPADMKTLPKGMNMDMPEGVLLGHNSYDEPSYRGPCPFDSNNYHYVFTLYALDTTLELSNNARIDEVVSTMRHHIINQTQLTGVYNH